MKYEIVVFTKNNRKNFELMRGVSNAVGEMFVATGTRSTPLGYIIYVNGTQNNYLQFKRRYFREINNRELRIREV